MGSLLRLDEMTTTTPAPGAAAVGMPAVGRGALRAGGQRGAPEKRAGGSAAGLVGGERCGPVAGESRGPARGWGKAVNGLRKLHGNGPSGTLQGGQRGALLASAARQRSCTIYIFIQMVKQRPQLKICSRVKLSFNHESTTSR